MLRIRPIPAQRVKVSIEVFGVREPCDTAGEILPVPPLIKEGTQKPPFVKGAARSAGGFGNVAVMKRTFASSIAWLAHSKNLFSLYMQLQTALGGAVLLEPLLQPLPAILGLFFTVARAVVSVEAVGRIRVEHDL